MSMCHCDGPPHVYDPSWCIRPRLDPPADRMPDVERFAPGPTGRARHRREGR